jgi:thiamine transport system substrate-binding protein
MRSYAVLIAIYLAVCGSLGAHFAMPSRESRVVTLLTHDNFDIRPDLIAEFERTHEASVRFLKAGDAGEVLDRAVNAAGRPLADALFGVDNAQLRRALAADIFEPYRSPELAFVPDRFQLDPSHRLLPVDFGDVGIVYDRDWFAARGLAPPCELADLTRPEYIGLTVVPDPAASSPGFAFLLATVARFGDPGYRDFWRDLRDNAVHVASGWKEAYWGHFTAAGQGDRPILVACGAGPAAGPGVAAMPGDRNAYRRIEFAGVLRDAGNPELARRLVDFLLDRRFQADIPHRMSMFPVREAVELPENFRFRARIAESPPEIPPERIERKREIWLAQWRETVFP